MWLGNARRNWYSSFQYGWAWCSRFCSGLENLKHKQPLLNDGQSCLSDKETLTWLIACGGNIIRTPGTMTYGAYSPAHSMVRVHQWVRYVRASNAWMHEYTWRMCLPVRVLVGPTEAVWVKRLVYVLVHVEWGIGLTEFQKLDGDVPDKILIA